MLKKKLKHTLLLGDTTVNVLDEQHGKGKFVIHVHQNENTAVDVAREMVQKEGGRLVTLEHNGQRNIRFCLEKTCFEFDPNRIFSHRGIKNTLEAHGAYDPHAHTQVKNLALLILSLLPKGKIIAVHNNSEYSIHDYLPEHALEKEARSIHLSESQFYRNFYLVTQKKTYERLKSMHLNCIWQSKSLEDDGSLSVFLSNRDYINIEAGFDQSLAQQQMLQMA